MYRIDHLIYLAQAGTFSPIDFVVAARSCPGYAAEKAKHLEEQYFDTKGLPITDEQYLEVLGGRIGEKEIDAHTREGVS